jgi:predicted nuclease of predicted toxin-antitoxin system
VKLLFDENLSPRLPSLLKDSFPECEHLRDLGLMGAVDSQLWEYARTNGFTIVSKDNDFRQRSFVEGAPPKIVWLSVGNAGTGVICQLLQTQLAQLVSFHNDSDAALLVLAL